MRFKRRFSAVLRIFLSAEGCGCLAEISWKVYVLIAVNIYIRAISCAVLCGCMTAENRGLNRMSLWLGGVSVLLLLHAEQIGIDNGAGTNLKVGRGAPKNCFGRAPPLFWL